MIVFLIQPSKIACQNASLLTDSTVPRGWATKKHVDTERVEPWA